jgi:VPDSG-CTERM motif
MKIKYLSAILVTLVGLGLSQRADAVLQMSWSTNSQYLVGTVIPGVQGQFGGQVDRDVYMTNTLLSYSAPSQQTNLGDGALYSRTTLPDGPAATATGAVPVTSGDMNIVNGIVNITLTNTFQYLVAAYDGPNGGVAIWDISSFHVGDTIQIYAYGHPDLLHPGDIVGGTSGNYFITSFTLLNPTGTVPDGGTTAMLLGAAFGALGITRRFLKI